MVAIVCAEGADLRGARPHVATTQDPPSLRGAERQHVDWNWEERPRKPARPPPSPLDEPRRASQSYQGAQHDVLPRIYLAKDLRRSIALDRHPWLFDRALQPSQDEVPPGAVVAICWKKDVLGLAIYDPESPLRARLLTWGSNAILPDDDWAYEVALEAARRRWDDRSLWKTDGIRLVHGEGDWMPGLVLDAYGSTGVVAFDGAGCEAFWRPKLGTILAALAAAGFPLRSVLMKGGKELLAGEEPPEGSSVFNENGVKYEVDVRHGHKTGFFLDQRDHRLRLRQIAAGKEVLDLFTYTGGFAVAAALGGARQVVAVDQAEKAIQACHRNFELNGLKSEIGPAMPRPAAGSSRARHRLVVGDCWDFLEQAVKHRDRYDIVVNDPPAMAPSEHARSKALGAYKQLNLLSMQLLRPGGRLITCSCSSHVTKKDLLQVIKAAEAAAGRRFEIEEEGQAGSDHPVRQGFPEGDYLQTLYLRAKD